MKELESWKKKKLKYIVSIQKGKVPKEMVTTNFNNELPVYLTMDYLRGVPKQIYYVPNFDKYIVVEDNEMLLLWDGSNAGEFLWSKKGVLSSTMAVVKPNNEINKQFLFYRFKEFERYLKDITVGMGIPHVNPQEFLNFSFFIPSLNEQTVIANYLDKKTAEIDDLIAKKERLLELYEEEKKAIINKAVTKGINPNVKMKDSGIPWLGEIPEHWEVKKLKYVAKVNERNLSENTDPNLLITYIDIGSVEFGKFKEEPKSLKFREAPSRARRIVNTGDTLVSTVRTYLKAIIYIDNVKGNTIASTGYAVITPTNYFVPKYLFYILSSEVIVQNITALSVGVSYPAINASEIETFKIWIPPLQEQQQIVSYIENQISLIDSKIEKTKKMIELLKEYKTSLISEVVTGKRRVV